MNLHDVIFAAGSVVLIAALIPALYKRIDVPLWTAALTGSVLAVYGINYLTMGFPLSAAGLLVQALLWGVVSYRSRQRPTMTVRPLSVHPTYEEVVLEDSPVSYWRLDEPDKPSWYADWHSPLKRHSTRWHRDDTEG